jgi:two-component sensor histidine kinase
MDDVVYPSDSIYERCKDLTADELSFLKVIEGQMPIVADISRADVLLYSWLKDGSPVVLAHAQPHSVSPVYEHSMVGQRIAASQDLTVVDTFLERVHRHEQDPMTNGAPIIKRTYPVRRPGQQRIVGVLRVETNLLEHERQRRRDRTFRRAVRQLQRMAQRAQLSGAESLSPLVGLKLRELDTTDDDLAWAALSQEVCIEQEQEVGGRYWITKAIPLHDLPRPGILRWLSQQEGPEPPSHLILIVRDTTESRRREQELRVKTALIQELHHRIKNNLQTIVALLRMQARRLDYEDARLAIEEAVGRILSVAVIHEFLSNQDSRVINVRDVGNRILNQMREGVLGPDKHIRFYLEGPPIYLPARQATACALVINELLQNAVEHGFTGRREGRVFLVLQDEGDTVVVRVHDNGSGMPDDFSVQDSDRLGLQIVQTLVHEDLKGTFEIQNGGGTAAIVTFPKSILGGELNGTYACDHCR